MATTAMASSLVRSTRDCIPEEPSVSSVAPSLTYSEESEDQDEEPQAEPPRRRRASTRLIAQSPADIQRITGESTAQLIQRCCGGGCCMKLGAKKEGLEYESIPLPDNDAYKSLALKIGDIPTKLTNIADLPEQTVFFEPVPRPAAATSSPTDSAISLGADARENKDADLATVQDRLKDFTLDNTDTAKEPPRYVQPHPPYHVYAARIDSARELTKPGAEKRTYHFDLDITSYPGGEDMDFRVGGAIGVTAPNDSARVDDVFDALMVPRFLRDKPVLLKTTKGRWPTVWGDDQARELLLRILAEYAEDPNEKKLLTFLCSAEGQGVFCDFRTGPHVSLSQLLHAFPSSHPPMDLLLSALQTLMPRFYSLSNDPHDAYKTRDGKVHRLVEIAVTVHETADWRGGLRTGIGSGFFERQAQKWLEAKRSGETPEIYIPMFKGLMANPLAKQFVSDGPMLLIGAGVGIAPFRGFVQRRLKTANCANKVWVLQGIRDSLVDEIYSGEWGVHEDEVKRVVQSRRGESRYVQEEVRNQADLVWYIANAVDGRVFVCGSTKGMGEGVEEALVDVAMQKGNLEREEAKKYWDLKKEAGQYIAETW
ncbi:putative FAD-dependent monooxygenase [Colletotrichum spaethianum]|uniref:FAD-dependent monooxygenase n=1 Tax=Colletotrichum spaethianum TaxID=700344 RepID=A0AA37PB15_9PEZI|nr:putative FAD-dependent monooxygenase [Colletotrichum spaethianum]GKT48895.1 putative FAD-dependent monooxygenase [Colletotrichum spaethianum]